MKFFGISLTSTFAIPIIISINPNAYFGFELSTGYLKFLFNGANVFIDQKFINYSGIWIPISISNFYSGTKSSYFPPMIDTTINKVTLTRDPAFQMPLLGIQITQFLIGYDCVALFAYIRFYKTYIHQPFGKLMR